MLRRRVSQIYCPHNGVLCREEELTFSAICSSCTLAHMASKAANTSSSPPSSPSSSLPSSSPPHSSPFSSSSSSPKVQPKFSSSSSEILCDEGKEIEPAEE